MKERLARSQARGTNQLSLINELLPGTPVPYRIVPVPAWIHGRQVITQKIGATGYALGSKPYLALRHRLVSVGFVLRVDRQNMTVTMTFPEEATQ